MVTRWIAEISRRISANFLRTNKNVGLLANALRRERRWMRVNRIQTEGPNKVMNSQHNLADFGLTRRSVQAESVHQGNSAVRQDQDLCGYKIWKVAHGRPRQLANRAGDRRRSLFRRDARKGAELMNAATQTKGPFVRRGSLCERPIDAFLYRAAAKGAIAAIMRVTLDRWRWFLRTQIPGSYAQERNSPARSCTGSAPLALAKQTGLFDHST